MHEQRSSGRRDTRDVIRIGSASTPDLLHSFQALPSTRDGTRFSDAALTYAVGLRLGADVAAIVNCSC